MEAIQIPIEMRETRGSVAGRRARRTGSIPAVVYGRGIEPRAVVVKEHTFTKTIRGCGPTQLFKFETAEGGLNGQLVLIKDIQIEPLKDKALHIDFLALSEDHRITLAVPIELKGESAAIKSGDFILNQSAFEIEIECLPNEIPKTVSIDISSLEGMGSIHASDVVLPKGVKLKSDADMAIVSAVHKREEEQEAPVAAAADATAAAATPGAAGAAAPAAGAEKTDEKADKKK